DRRGLLHHLEAAAAGNHGEPGLWLDLTMLQATYQLVERVVAPDVFTHQGDLAGRGRPCGGMNRARLRVCRLPSRKRVERPMNCANVYCDACPDPRERTSDLSQVVHAAEARSEERRVGKEGGARGIRRNIRRKRMSIWERSCRLSSESA